MYEARIVVGKTLDGWTVSKLQETGGIYALTSPGVHGKLTKREAVEIANHIGQRDGLPVVIGD